MIGKTIVGGKRERKMNDAKEVYYIGGSPCAGKSSVAEILSRKYGLCYFKVDDFLDRYIQAGAWKECPVCRKVTSMNAEQIWMREPILQ